MVGTRDHQEFFRLLRSSVGGSPFCPSAREASESDKRLLSRTKRVSSACSSVFDASMTNLARLPVAPRTMIFLRAPGTSFDEASSAADCAEVVSGNISRQRMRLVSDRANRSHFDKRDARKYLLLFSSLKLGIQKINDDLGYFRLIPHHTSMVGSFYYITC